jgi:hypothetical protein
VRRSDSDNTHCRARDRLREFRSTATRRNRFRDGAGCDRPADRSSPVENAIRPWQTMIARTRERRDHRTPGGM